MSNKVKENAEATTMYFEDTQAIITDSQKVKAQEDPRVSRRNPTAIEADDKIALWGETNKFPQIIDEALELNADLASSLSWQARALYAGGVDYEVYDYVTDTISKKRIAAIDQFLERNMDYPIKATVDFYKYMNIFPEMIMNDGRSEIHWITCRETNECRYALQDNQGRIKRVYISANWEDGVDTVDPDTLSRPVVNPLTASKEAVTKQISGNKFIYPLSYPTGKKYYQLAHWNGIRKNGWLDLANEIPQFKMQIMKNQITPKYHIKFPDYYWKWKFPDWETFNNKKKKELKEAEFVIFNTYLRGTKNAGKAIATGFKVDKNTAKEFPGVQIVAIDDKLKDGIYLEDSVEATIKIFSALGLDPTLYGIIPGKGGSNRSGTDKREALNIYLSLVNQHSDILLRPYIFASRFNGWSNDEQLIMWKFKAPLLQTLDQVTPANRETTIPEEDGTTN